VLGVFRVLRVIRVLRVLGVFRVLRVLRVFRVFGVLRSLAQQKKTPAVCESLSEEIYLSVIYFTNERRSLYDNGLLGTR
jgi:hypothetical protein